MTRLWVKILNLFTYRMIMYQYHETQIRNQFITLKMKNKIKKYKFYFNIFLLENFYFLLKKYIESKNKHRVIPLTFEMGMMLARTSCYDNSRFEEQIVRKFKVINIPKGYVPIS